MNELRKHEKELVKEIQNYLNERNEDGIRVDENTVITLTSVKKKIHLSKREYEERVREMLCARGIDDDEFFKGLLNKTRDIVQEQKISIIK